jgi:hypothetical protein
MIDPKARMVLLPEDREIMALTGMSEAEYREFQLWVIEFSKPRPCQPTALGFLATVAINLAIGVLLTAASMLLAPKQQEPEQAEYEESKTDGQDIVKKDRFAPKNGFNSVQNVVELGSVVPIVYAKRETIDGDQYGGIRVNTNLLWSQLMSIGGSQFFRGIFLVGECNGDQTGPFIADEQTALGNNLLGNFDLRKDRDAGRVSIYYAPGTGRIKADDLVAGVKAAKDLGNANPGSETGDVYEITSTGNGLEKDFCMAVQPSNQIAFGVYDLIGNNFGYKIGEDFKPLSQWQQRADTTRERQSDNQRYAERAKQIHNYTTRAGIISITRNGADLGKGVVNVNEGDIITYKIFSDSEAERVFIYSPASSGGAKDGETGMRDTAATIASIQRGFDESINVGDLYRIGSALAVCVERGNPFISETEYDGEQSNDMEAKFQVVDNGNKELPGPARGQVEVFDVDDDINPAESADVQGKLATETSHIFRVSVGAVALERAARVIEIGFRSTLGVKSSSITNFNGLEARERFNGTSSGDVQVEDGSYQAYVDAEYCGGMDDGEDTDDDTYRNEIIAGKYSASDDRYSFFRLWYRNLDSTNFTQSTDLYGFRNQTNQPIYNFMRVQFPDTQRRELRFEPITSWEIRDNRATGDLFVIDSKVTTTVSLHEDGDLMLTFQGEQIARTSETFEIQAFTNRKDVQVDAIDRISIESAGSKFEVPADPDAPDAWPRTATYKCDLLNGSGRGARAEVTIEWQLAPDPLDPPEQIPAPNEGRCVGISFSSDRGTRGSGYRVGDILTIDCEDTCGPCDKAVMPTFRVTSLKSFDPVALGGGPYDDPENFSYVDGWARLAEDFIYSEVSSSAKSPEHEVSYVNIITDNNQDPNYTELAIAGFNIHASKDINSLDQLSVYVTEGVLDSHLFPDVFRDLLTNPRYGTGSFFSAEQIDDDSFVSAAAFTEGRRYFFDGAITQKLNLRSWGADSAAHFLLDLSVSGGRFKLAPVVNFDGAEQVNALFTAGNILDDSFEMNYFDRQDRLSPKISVRWREERRSLAAGDRGLFPQIREVMVSRIDAGADAPEEQIDLTDFCTNERHAIDRAKWLCQQRKYVTHSVKFKTIPTQAPIEAGSVIKVGLETLRYDSPVNGVISDNGYVTSTAPLNRPTLCITWDGTTMQREELDFSNAEAVAEMKNKVFMTVETEIVSQGYKVQSVGFDEEGNLDVEATYWPLASDDTSLLLSDFSDANFNIER